MKLAKMKVVEMRKELDARGLDSSGTRPTLMKRLKEALNREEDKKALEQKTEVLSKAEKTRQSERDQTGNKEDDSKTPSPRPSVTTSPKEAEDLPNQEDSSPREAVAAASEEQAPTATQQPAPAQGTDKPATSGAIGHSSEMTLDERMQKRLLRFGAVKDVPDTTKDAIQRRRKRFGIVDKDQEEKPTKRRRPSTEVDEQVLKEHEEAKKRRAIKFGISLNASKEPAASSAVSADETEKRLRRQRRFQQVGY